MGPMAKAIATKSSSFRHEIQYLDESILSQPFLSVCLPAISHYLTFPNAVWRRQNMAYLYKNILGDYTQIISVDLVLIVLSTQSLYSSRFCFLEAEHVFHFYSLKLLPLPPFYKRDVCLLLVPTPGHFVNQSIDGCFFHFFTVWPQFFLVYNLQCRSRFPIPPFERRIFVITRTILGHL